MKPIPDDELPEETIERWVMGSVPITDRRCEVALTRIEILVDERADQARDAVAKMFAKARERVDIRFRQSMLKLIAGMAPEEYDVFNRGRVRQRIDSERYDEFDVTTLGDVIKQTIRVYR